HGDPGRTVRALNRRKQTGKTLAHLRGAGDPGLAGQAGQAELERTDVASAPLGPVHTTLVGGDRDIELISASPGVGAIDRRTWRQQRHRVRRPAVVIQRAEPRGRVDLVSYAVEAALIV